MEKRHKLDIFKERLKKLGIEITIVGNFPWIYLATVNGRNVKEVFLSDHRFTIGFLPIKPHVEFEFSDISELFRVIRKYL